MRVAPAGRPVPVTAAVSPCGSRGPPLTSDNWALSKSFVGEGGGGGGLAGFLLPRCFDRFPLWLGGSLLLMHLAVAWSTSDERRQTLGVWEKGQMGAVASFCFPFFQSAR
ncbi:hypothetical protein LY76DRAFT_162274 [Colletotrichum caudatum]|nr:hypothetical protein LY76DRAFT_162274 [Colletotrichum caudatum]